MKIEHAAIWAKDIEKMKLFYETYFEASSNQKYTNDGNNFSSYFLSFNSSTRLEIMQMPSVPETENNPYKHLLGLSI